MIETTLVFASTADHRASQQMAAIVRDVVSANKAARIRVEPLDPDTQGARSSVCMKRLGSRCRTIWH